MKRFNFSFSSYAWIILTLIAGLIGCKSTAPAITQTPSFPAEIYLPPELVMPGYISDSVYLGLLQPAMVFKFYQQFGSELVWHDRAGITMLGDTLLSFIVNARYYGLQPEHYHSNEFIKIDSNVSLTRKEALLTDAFISMAHDLHHGQLKPDVHYEDSVYLPLLLHVLNQGHLTERLQNQEPEFIQYKFLRKALGLLLDTMDVNSDEAIWSVQDIENSTSYRRIRLIELNLERWRQENIPFAQRYLLVNIPAFSLQVIDSNQVVFDSKIIVGKPEKPTPLLSSVIECVSVYPYWHVPRKISVEEYLPILQRDTSFIRRNNFEVLDKQGKILRADTLQWSRFSKNYFPISLRQREGEENSLGVIKFVFDNPYAVYLHDTNNKQLFRSDRRALSHGCVRVEKATALSHYLVTENLSHKSKVITRYLAEKRAHQVNLLHPIPIYIRYFTCAVQNNMFYEFHDVYEMDRELEKLLYPPGTQQGSD